MGTIGLLNLLTYQVMCNCGFVCFAYYGAYHVFLAISFPVSMGTFLSDINSAIALTAKEQLSPCPSRI